MTISMKMIKKIIIIIITTMRISNSDLILYWRFDEGKGNTIEDLSTNNNTGIIVARDSNNLWMKLDEGDPLEIEDKWG